MTDLREFAASETSRSNRMQVVEPLEPTFMQILRREFRRRPRPWFRMEHCPPVSYMLRMTGGQPDKIWSWRAWSPQMALLSLRPKPFYMHVRLPAYTIWHNKLGTFGQPLVWPECLRDCGSSIWDDVLYGPDGAKEMRCQLEELTLKNFGSSASSGERLCSRAAGGDPLLKKRRLSSSSEQYESTGKSNVQNESTGKGKSNAQDESTDKSNVQNESTGKGKSNVQHESTGNSNVQNESTGKGKSNVQDESTGKDKSNVQDESTGNGKSNVQDERASNEKVRASHADELMRGQIKAKNRLENYCYTVIDTLAYVPGAPDRDKIRKAAFKIFIWLDEEVCSDVEKGEFEAKQKELENVVNPIIRGLKLAP